jgi:hypothetical protein
MLTGYEYEVAAGSHCIITCPAHVSIRNKWFKYLMDTRTDSNLLAHRADWDSWPSRHSARSA